MVQMTERDRRFYKDKMKEIKDALERGDKAEANRRAEELKNYFDVQ